MLCGKSLLVAVVVVCCAGPLAAGDVAVLTHGPVLGDIGPDHAKVWVRTDSEAAVHIEYGVEADLSDAVPCLVRYTERDADFTRIFHLRRLEPGTTYFFNVLIDGVRQNETPFPTFTTAPARGEQEVFSFAVLADQAKITKFPNAGCPVFRAIARRNPRFVVQIGDYDHRFGTGANITLDGVRQMHKDLRSVETVAGKNFVDHLQRFPLYHVHDDHDWGWQWGDTLRTGLTYSPYADIVLQAFREYYPSPPLGNPDEGCWAKFEYANCEFFLLDARARRDRQDDPDDDNKSMLAGEDIYNNQKDWLKQGLLASRATWKFIFCGVLFNDTVGRYGTYYHYPNEKQELLNFLDENAIHNVIWISGDYHTGGAIDDGTNAGLPEVLVPHTNLQRGTPSTDIKGDWSVGGIGRGPTAPYNAGYAFIRVGTNPDRVALEILGLEGRRLRLVLLAQP